ncbi:hypothetical protein WR25_10158 [Diploscapter pachys]|uniref:Uncharacterized protein n=1 Tax=Diploscapter pachys TaxID=2018661 RepID=A0A2A2L6A2_9BILA|nr:hypothetical protein WR25_10158 [Diploscapter pachys]
MSARNSVVSLSSTGSNSRIETKLAENHTSSARAPPSTASQEGAMLPSSSSKDDILSTSSDEIENIAMRTLDNLEERKSIVSVKSNETSVDSIDKEKIPDDKKKDVEKADGGKGGEPEKGFKYLNIILYSYQERAVITSHLTKPTAIANFKDAVR